MVQGADYSSHGLRRCPCLPGYRRHNPLAACYTKSYIHTNEYCIPHGLYFSSSATSWKVQNEYHPTQKQCDKISSHGILLHRQQSPSTHKHLSIISLYVAFVIWQSRVVHYTAQTACGTSRQSRHDLAATNA